MIETPYVYRETRLRQAMRPSPHAIAVVAAFAKRPLGKTPQFFTSAERKIDLGCAGDEELLRYAQKVTARMGAAALTLVSPVLISRRHNEESGEVMRLHFAVKEVGKLRRITAALDHIPDYDHLSKEASPPDTVYTDLAIGLLARNQERLEKAKNALLRDVNNPRIQPQLRVMNPKIVERHITTALG